MAFIVNGYLSASSKSIQLYSVYDRNALGVIIDAFEQETGIQVELTSKPSLELLADLKNPSKDNKGVDLYLDKDITYLNLAEQAQLFTSINDRESIAIKDQFYSRNHQWLLLFYRSRTVVYNTNKYSVDDFKTYLDLAKPQFKDKICMRKAESSYNKALISYMVYHHGAVKTLDFLEGLNNNSIKPLMSSDSAMIAAVGAGTCDIAIVNTYYLPKFIEENPNFPVRPVFLNQDSFGAHINGIGMGLLKTSDDKELAQKFISFMASHRVQEYVANAFRQYPANKNATLDPILESFGVIKSDYSSLSNIGYYQDMAYSLMKQSGL